jgi:hypothetical protein
MQEKLQIASESGVGLTPLLGNQVECNLCGEIFDLAHANVHLRLLCRGDQRQKYGNKIVKITTPGRDSEFLRRMFALTASEPREKFMWSE